MPNRDGTGPVGAGPINRSGGRGLGRRMNVNSTKRCICPKCGYEMESSRGVPCTQVKCPKCDSMMKGEACI